MKKIIYILFFFLFSASVFQTNSQTALLNLGNSNEEKVTFIKTFESKYFNGKVYLHLTINGNTETKIVAIERSLDGTNYEVIGYINIIGTNVQTDLAYYFTDESPSSFNMFYRLSDYSDYNEPVYSVIISIIPVDENNNPSIIIPTTTTILCDEQKSSLIEASK